MTRLPLDLPALAGVAAPYENELLDAVTAVRRGEAPSVAARLLSDLTRPESQTVWLRWLARELWRKAGGRRREPCGSFLWEEERCDGLHYTVTWAYGGMNGLYRVGYGCLIPGGYPCGRDDMRCPALPDPDSADAPIQALVLACLTVAGGAR